jgi:hypothetical protein
MTDAELVDTLAGSLELLANRLGAMADLVRLAGEATVQRALAELRDQAREAAALAGEPRDDTLEEMVLALRAVANDWELGQGLGLEPTLHRLTWEKVERVLRRCGAL